MKWQDYKAEKLKDEKFKKAYDELEEEFSALNKKLAAEYTEKNFVKNFSARNEKYFEQTANL